MRDYLLRLWHDQVGRVSVENALMVAVLAVGTLGAMVGIAEKLGSAEERFSSSLPGLMESRSVEVEHPPR